MREPASGSREVPDNQKAPPGWGGALFTEPVCLRCLPPQRRLTLNNNKGNKEEAKDEVGSDLQHDFVSCRKTRLTYGRV